MWAIRHADSDGEQLVAELKSLVANGSGINDTVPGARWVQKVYLLMSSRIAILHATAAKQQKQAA